MSDNTKKTERYATVNKENDRPFDLSFAFRKKSDPDNPFMTVNLRGEVAKKITLFLAALGAVAAIITIIKTVRFIKKFF